MREYWWGYSPALHMHKWTSKHLQCNFLYCNWQKKSQRKTSCLWYLSISPIFPLCGLSKYIWLGFMLSLDNYKNNLKEMNTISRKILVLIKWAICIIAFHYHFTFMIWLSLFKCFLYVIVIYYWVFNNSVRNKEYNSTQTFKIYLHLQL